MTNDPFKNFKPLNAKPASKPASKASTSNSFVESMRDMGGSVMKSLKNDVVKGTAQSIFDQLVGSAKTGQAPDMNQNNTPDLGAFIAEREKQAADQARSQERSFHMHKAQETKVLFSHADESLRKEIDGVRQELQMLVASMGKVEQQIEKAVMDNVVDAGVYHLNFFRNLQGWLRMMRKSLEDASLWLEMSSGRGKRSHYWKQFGKSGTKYSLSSERTLATQAG